MEIMRGKIVEKTIANKEELKKFLSEAEPGSIEEETWESWIEDGFPITVYDVFDENGELLEWTTDLEEALEILNP